MESFAQMSVLVAEDTPATRDFLHNGLKRVVKQLDFVGVGDGLAALKQLQSRSFDLLLVDWEMPKMDGLELMQRIKQAGHHRAMAMVMVTGKGGREFIVQAIESGADGYIVKPFNDEKLVAAIQGALRRKQGGSGAPDADHQEPKQKLQLEVDFAGQATNLIATAVTKKEVRGVVKRTDCVPVIQSQAVVRIPFDRQAREYPTLVSQLSVGKCSEQGEYINVNLCFGRLNDDDSAFLNNYIVSLRQH